MEQAVHRMSRRRLERFGRLAVTAALAALALALAFRHLAQRRRLAV
jgi:hypothetical protein